MIEQRMKGNIYLENYKKMDNFDLKKYLAEGRLNERQFFDDKQLANDILRNQADVERQLDTVKRF